MSADKYPSIFSHQMEAIVYIIPNLKTSKSVKHKFCTAKNLLSVIQSKKL